MEEKQRAAAHKITVDARKKMSVSGVLDVVSFDAKEVILETEMGVLTIHGDELHVNRLTLEKGEIDIDGRIDSFCYADKKSGTEESFLKRMFR